MWRPSRPGRRAGVTIGPMREINVDGAVRTRVEELLGRRRDMWVIGTGVIGILVVALLLWGRGAAPRIAPPASSSGPAEALAVPTATPLVYVDVSGAVREPGLYTLPLGARVADALDAAGGTRARADLSALNLAQALADGTKVDVPTRGGPVAAIASPAAGADPTQGPAAVPLNTADEAALESIPGVGPVTAQAILDYRAQIGSFDSLDQLLDVDGIGPATLAAIRPYLSI